jgi:hypothetical protein
MSMWLYWIDLLLICDFGQYRGGGVDRDVTSFSCVENQKAG